MSHLPTSPIVRRARLAEAMADTLQVNLEQMETRPLSESTARLELALEDVGWQRLAAIGQHEFSRHGVEQAALLCRLMWRKNPLIKRGVDVRTYFTWAQGVSITARDETIQDRVVGPLLEDPWNVKTWSGHEARERLDRTLATDGNVPLILATGARGEVQVRPRQWTEFQEPLRDRDDGAIVRFWHRRWDEDGQVRELLHPDVSWQPVGVRPGEVNGIEVRWDQPVLMVQADRLEGDTWGVPEVYAALDWARAYKEFLEDWASYVRSLARFAWRHKAGSKGSARTIRDVHGTARMDSSSGRQEPAGQTAVGTDIDGLEPVKHSGAHVDATSGRPLAVMVAAAFDMPYTLLTGDADNSNLATAKALDRPFELALTSRQRMWAGVQREVIDYAIDASVRAPGGALRGRVERDGFGRSRVVLPEGMDRTVDVDWPQLVEHDLKEYTEALKNAVEAQPDLPPDVTAGLLLTAFGVDNVDDLVEDVARAAADRATEREAEEVAETMVAEALREALARDAA
jgi:hypothetical protein